MARERIFRFKQFEVINDKTPMKVGTDGVLLGAWCPLSGVKRVLDVGTGCGLIALMAAQRNCDCMIDAIDIDSFAIAEAKQNFANSPWKNRLNATQADFKEYSKTDQTKYDLIVSNPPFFTNGVLPPESGRCDARHTNSLSFQDLLHGAKCMLSDNGKIAIISPIENFKEIVEICKDKKLQINEIVKVYSLKNCKPKRLLWVISAQSEGMKTSSIIIENEKGTYSTQYKELCKEFYLKF